MKFNSRIIGSFVSLLAILSVACASYVDYSVNLKVAPSIVYSNDEVVIFGYLDLNDWGKMVAPSALSLDIMKGNSLERSYVFNDLLYVNDINDSSFLVDGFFFKKVTGLSAGTYNAILKIEGNSKVWQKFDVINGTSNLIMNFNGVAQNGNITSAIVNLNYTGAGTLNANLYLYGRKNFDAPLIVSESGLTNNGVGFDVPSADTNFNLSTYADPEQVFGLVILAQGSNGNSTEPQVAIIRTGVKSSVYDASLLFSSRDIKKGVNEPLEFSLMNNGSLPSNFTIETAGSLSAYVVVPSRIFLNPGQSVTDFIQVNVPRNSVLSSGNLTLSIKTAGVVVENKSFSLNLLTADPLHSVIVSGVSLESDDYLAGESIKGNISLTNDGDFTEMLSLTYGCEGSASYRESVSINKGRVLNLSFMIDASDVPVDGCSLVIGAVNGNYSYTKTISINVIPVSYSFSMYADKDNVVSHDSLTETFGLTLRNTGNVENQFTISSVNYANYLISNSTVLLKPGEIVRVNATVNVPLNVEVFNVTFAACSLINVTCKQDTVLFTVFKTVASSESASKVNILNSSLSVEPGKGAIYMLDLVNNKPLAMNYLLNYSAEDNVSVAIYPGRSFVVQPGDSVAIYVHASSADAGNYNITYALSENNVLLSNGTLKLAVGTGLAGMTGFAVATGSVLGIAGLVILVLFIYFYFIRKPPQSDDEFKPVEVKKADLTKTSVNKNETRYW